MIWIPDIAANGEIPISAPAMIFTTACCADLMSENIPDLKNVSPIVSASVALFTI
jgi:hypothetical protein